MKTARTNTIAGLALAGVPQIMTTFTVEQLMAARRIEALGAGLLVRKKDIKTIHERIEQVSRGDEFRLKAHQFADKYAEFDGEMQTRRMLASLNTLGI